MVRLLVRLEKLHRDVLSSTTAKTLSRQQAYTLGHKEFIFGG